LLWLWFRAFLFTQIIECPIYMRGLRCPLWAAFGASAITHPIVWFGIFHPLVPGSYWGKVIAAELFAWLGEAAYFRLVFKKRRAWLWSLAANGASFGFGLLSRHLFGAP
jgi:hypothetical protein